MYRMTMAGLVMAAAPFFFLPTTTFAQGGGAAIARNPDSTTTPSVSNGSVSVDPNHPSRSLPTTEAGGGPERTTALNGRVFRGIFKPEGRKGTTGSATMAPGQQMGTTVITLHLDGVAPGTFNWHVHVGRCGDHGTALLGSRSMYPPVHINSSGSGTARVTLSVPPPSGGNYYVALHPQNGGEDQIVACANLLESGV